MRTWNIVVLGLLLCLGPAESQTKARVFLCTAKAVGEMRDDGSMAPARWTKERFAIQNKFIYDDAAQTLRWEKLDRSWQYRRVQPGSEANDLVAVRMFDGAASTVVDVLRIRTWKPGNPFMLVEQDEVYTGKCAAF